MTASLVILFGLCGHWNGGKSFRAIEAKDLCVGFHFKFNLKGKVVIHPGLKSCYFFQQYLS